MAFTYAASNSFCSFSHLCSNWPLFSICSAWISSFSFSGVGCGRLYSVSSVWIIQPKISVSSKVSCRKYPVSETVIGSSRVHCCPLGKREWITFCSAMRILSSKTSVMIATCPVYLNSPPSCQINNAPASGLRLQPFAKACKGNKASFTTWRKNRREKIS